MSQRRKTRKKKNKQRIVAMVLLVVAAISLLTVFIVYTVFVKRAPVASFFPENPVFYSRFNLSPSLVQAKNFLDVSERFEDPDVFVNFVTDFVFGNVDKDQFNLENEDLVGWIGGEVAIGNIATSDFDTSSVMIVHVKNKEKAGEFLDNLNDQLRKRGDAINEITFRDELVVNITGHRDISYTQTKDHLLISSGESGIKKMLDVHLGVEKSLLESIDYKNTEKALRGNKEMVFFYYDLLELSITLLDTLKLGGSDALLSKLGYGADLPSGFVLIPEGDGFKTKILAHEGEGGTQDFKEKLTEFIPHDPVFYLEGNSLSEFVEGLLVGDAETDEDQDAQAIGIKRAIELQYGFNIDTDLFPLLQNQYALTILRGNERGNVNAALLLDLEDVSLAEEKLPIIEKLVIEALAQSGDDSGKQFTQHVYDNEKYRHLNLDDSLKFDVNYKIIGDQLVITTTEEGMKTFIDLQNGGEKLSNDVLFKQSVQKVDVGKSKQLIYMEPQAGLKLLDELTPFDYGFVDQEVRKMESLTLKNHTTRDGVILEGFLKIKN